MDFLYQFKFIRSLYVNQTFIKVNGKWINILKFTHGKVEDVDGIWYNQIFCNCGNELIHSKSYIRSYQTSNHTVDEFKCSYCGLKQFWNGGLAPGFLRCDEHGNI